MFQTGVLGLLALGLWPAPVAGLDPAVPFVQHVHERWGPRDGLPDGPVLSLLPARDGSLWVGTAAGLLRFDGLRFHAFEPGSQGLGSVSFARRLLEADDGTVYAAMVGGIVRYDGRRFSTLGEDAGLAHPFLYALAPAVDGGFWAGSAGSGLWHFAEGRFVRDERYVAGGFSELVADLAVDGRGTVWVATGDGLVALDSEVRRFGPAEGLGSAVVSVLHLDPQGRLWVGTRGGLSRWEGRRFRTWSRRDGLPSDDVTAIASDGDAIWVGTRAAGLSRLRAERIERVADPGSERTGILSLAVGGDGTLWVGTDQGLERYRQAAFRTLRAESGLADERVLNVASRAAGGVYLLDGAGAVVVVEAGRASPLLPVGAIADQGMVPLAEGPEGSLWIGGAELRRLRAGRLERHARAGGAFTVVLPEKDGVVVAQTRPDGTSALSRFVGDRFLPITVGAPLPHVQRLLRDRSSRLWIATGGAGLVCLTGAATRRFDAAAGLPHDTVYGLLEDERGSLWAGTRAGLARVREGRVCSLEAAQGAPRRAPLHLVADAQRRLWVAAEDGVHVLSLDELDAFCDHAQPIRSFRRFGREDGLRSIEFSWRSPGHAKTGGSIAFATGRGLSVVDPADVALAPPAPPVLLEELRIARSPVEITEPVRVDPAGRDRVSLQFTAPAMEAPGQLRFRYRLAGYTDEWIDSQGGRVASFTNLPPGSFTLEVAARRPDGPWGTPATVRLEVAPRWHERPLARLGGLVVLGMALVTGHRLRLRQTRRRARELAALVEDRTRALTQEVTERRRAEDEARELNAQLEARVRQRTAEIEGAREALARQSERLTVTLASLAEAVIGTDVGGGVTLMNPVAERYTGLAAAAAAGRPIEAACRLVSRFDRRPLRNPAMVVLGPAASRPQALIQALLALPSGEEILVDASAAPVRDPEGRLVGAVLVLRDVTERTLSEERLQRAQKLESLGVLAGGIAHDFNNLLTGIFGQVDLARRQIADSPAARRLDSALEVLESARGLTRQLLTFSAGGRPATEPHAIGELLRRCARFALSGSEHEAELDLPEDLWACSVDPHQIRQAVDNLLLNARQAMPEGGRVRIRAGNRRLEDGNAAGLPAGRYVRISICDQGEGIPAELQPRVFEPFFTTKPAGSGLGLAMVHSIVTRHGGAVRFDSRPGAGTCFHVLLPAATGGPEPSARVVPVPAASRRCRILVMDDEPVLREVTRAALEAEGHEVEEAASGEQAVEAAAQALRAGTPFDLAILDLTVPGGLGGVPTLRRLREIAPRLRAIATSGYASGPVLAEPRAFGFDGTLPKPWAVADLLAAVEAVLQAP